MNKNYTPLYRKYRPQNIEEIVGQEHIKKALTNAIEMKRISHAYLFTGPRGTGKTSTARIFAKSLNCVNGPTIKPCNECENCKNITNAIPIDVIEIDAASNRSVNDAEEIIQNVAMAPVHSRYKIYIIDEVHMLTPTAFNALLKTLEEPPENVIFILATTEVHKVLDTIKSRCQRFDFKRITTDDITKHLRNISDKENINITDEALSYIAQNSAGGMRDSIALLDQLSVLNSEESKISVEDINRLLGRLSFDDLNQMFLHISQSNQQAALDKLNEIYNQGNEPSQILSNFLEYLRNALIIKSVGKNLVRDIIQLNEEQINKLSEITDNIENHQIVSLIDKCSSYIKELKLTSTPKLWLDIAILDMANLVQNTKLEELQKRISLLENGEAPKINTSVLIKPKIAATTVQKQHSDSVAEITESVQKNNNVTEPKEQQVSVPKESVSPDSAGVSGGTSWQSFLDCISSAPSRTILKQQAVGVKIAPDEIILAIRNPIWLKKFSPDGDKYPFLIEAAKALFGENTPKVIVRTPQAGDDKIRSQQSNSDSQELPSQIKKPLIIENKISEKAEISQALEQKSETSQYSEDDEDNEYNSSEEEPKIITKLSQSESTFHSDNVRMVMDLFEGKLIE